MLAVVSQHDVHYLAGSQCDGIVVVVVSEHLGGCVLSSVVCGGVCIVGDSCEWSMSEVDVGCVCDVVVAVCLCLLFSRRRPVDANDEVQGPSSRRLACLCQLQPHASQRPHERQACDDHDQRHNIHLHPTIATTSTQVPRDRAYPTTPAIPLNTIKSAARE
jgi:hypothetical protein